MKMTLCERLRLAARVLRLGDAAFHAVPSPRLDELRVTALTRKVIRLSSAWDCKPEMVEQAKRHIAAELGHAAESSVVFDVSCDLDDGYYQVRGELYVPVPPEGGDDE